MALRKRGEATRKVEEASRPLADEMKKKDEDDIEEFVRHRSRAFPDHPQLPADLERIVEATFRVDVKATYDRLVEQLKIEGVELGDRGTVSAHLNRAEENFRQAHNLFVVAKLERERWEAKNAIVVAATWEAATAILQQEKVEGERKKQITNEDVRLCAARKFPDQWAHAEERASQIKLMTAQFENLVECWRSRCHTLRVLLETRR